jgi:hypothetical protein
VNLLAILARHPFDEYIFYISPLYTGGTRRRCIHQTHSRLVWLVVSDIKIRNPAAKSISINGELTE